MKVLLSFLFFVASCIPVNKVIEGKVVGVSDGDTFTLLVDNHTQVKVRLYGVDCPEKKQAFGNAAKQFTSNLIFGKRVKVNYSKKDRYGRIVGMAYLNASENVNEKLLTSGYAWHYKEYDQNPAWAKLENQARQRKVGLWAQAGAVEPWSWRKMKRQKIAVD